MSLYYSLGDNTAMPGGLSTLGFAMHGFLVVNRVLRSTLYARITTSFVGVRSLSLAAFVFCRRNILKISLFYGDIKYSEFTQYEAYDVPTLLGIRIATFLYLKRSRKVGPYLHTY